MSARYIALFIVALSFFIIAPKAQAGYFVAGGELHINENGPLFAPLVIGGHMWEVDTHLVGFEAFCVLVPGWGECYAGLAWAPVPELTLIASTGVESDGGDSYVQRFAFASILAIDWFSLAAVVEWNSTLFDGVTDSILYDAIAGFLVYDDGSRFQLEVGAHGRRGVGIGPVVAGHIKLYGVDTEETDDDVTLHVSASLMVVDTEAEDPTDLITGVVITKFGF